MQKELIPEASLRALSEAAGKVSEGMREMARHGRSVSESLIYHFQRAYAEAGYPYGDTPKGFRKWLRREARRRKS